MGAVAQFGALDTVRCWLIIAVVAAPGQHNQHWYVPPALALRGRHFARAATAWRRFDRKLRRVAALRHFTQPPASILSTCQMNLDSMIGPLNAAGF